MINALIANPSNVSLTLSLPLKNYLIDGFPRAVDQAIYFEQHVCEAQTVLFYDVSEEILVKRCKKRAETSGRADDNMTALMKRFKEFNDQSKPVVDLYKKFGKVRWIDASGDIGEVY